MSKSTIEECLETKDLTSVDTIARPVTPVDSYDKDGYDFVGYNEAGYNQAGFNRDGYDINGNYNPIYDWARKDTIEDLASILESKVKDNNLGNDVIHKEGAGYTTEAVDLALSVIEDPQKIIEESKNTDLGGHQQELDGNQTA